MYRVNGKEFDDVDSALKYAQEFANESHGNVRVTDGDTLERIVRPEGAEEVVEDVEEPVEPDQAQVTERPAVEINGMPDDDDFRFSVGAVLNEINEYFEGSDEHVLVERIADWINRCTMATVDYFNKSTVGAPIGSDGKPLLPGEMVCYRGMELDPGVAFKVVAVDQMGNVYCGEELRPVEGSLLVHARFQSRRDVLNWFYHEMRDCDPNREDEITARAEFLLEAF